MLWSLFFKFKRINSPSTVGLVSRELHAFSKMFGRGTRYTTNLKTGSLFFFTMGLELIQTHGYRFCQVPPVRGFQFDLKARSDSLGHTQRVYEAGFFFPRLASGVSNRDLSLGNSPHLRTHEKNTIHDSVHKRLASNSSVLTKTIPGGRNLLYQRGMSKSPLMGLSLYRGLRHLTLTPKSDLSFLLPEVRGGAKQSKFFTVKKTRGGYRDSRPISFGRRLLSGLRTRKLRFFKKDNRFLNTYGSRGGSAQLVKFRVKLLQRLTLRRKLMWGRVVLPTSCGMGFSSSDFIGSLADMKPKLFMPSLRCFGGQSALKSGLPRYPGLRGERANAFTKSNPNFSFRQSIVRYKPGIARYWRAHRLFFQKLFCASTGNRQKRFTHFVIKLAHIASFSFFKMIEMSLLHLLLVSCLIKMSSVFFI